MSSRLSRIRVVLLVLSLVGAGAAWAPSAWAVDPPDLSLTSPNPTNGNPSLSWTPVLLALTYTVERSDSTCASAAFTPIDTLSLLQTTYTDMTAAADGPYCYRVIASDGFITPDGISNEVGVTVDRTAPVTSITSGPSGTINDATPTYLFSSAGSDAIACQLDGGPPAACSSPETLGPFGNGETHTFTVIGSDAAGNSSTDSRTFTVDLAGPAAPSIDSGPSGTTSSDSATFTFSSGDAGGGFECQLDGDGFSGCSSPRTYNGLGDGSHTFQVRAIDGAGNEGAAASRTWTVDTSGPAVTITGGPSGPTSDPTPTFTFTSADAVTFNCDIDGSFGPCTSPFTSAPLADGPHVFRVQGFDGAGNPGDLEERNFSVDTVGPATTITGGPTGATTDTTPTFTFSSDPGATFQCSVDAGAFVSCTSPRTISPVGEGPHTFNVQAIDGLGNGGAVASRGFTVDTTGPAAPSIDSGPSGTTSSDSATFTFSSGDAAGGFECQLDGGGFAGCTSPRSYNGLGDGSHTFQVRAIDGLGNEGAAASRTWTVDTSGPAVNITGGPTGPTSDPTPTFTFTSADAVTFNCDIDGSFAPCTSPFTSAPLADGPHVFRVQGFDGAGNGGDLEERNFSVDTVGPPTTITGGPTGATTDTTPTFTFSSEAGATFQCRVDAGPFVGCASPRTIAAVAEGGHTFSVQAIDGLGNGGAVASRAFTVDTTDPDTTITAGPAAGSTQGTDVAVFAFSASEPGATFQCRLDAAAFAACNGGASHSLSGLSEGSHTFQVRAEDAAGNQDGSPASRTWNVDTAPPNTTINSGPTGETNDSTPTFTFSSEPGATFECRFTGQGTFSACASGVTYGPLPEGSYLFEVRALDSGGNPDPSPASRSFSVDATAPDTGIVAGPAGPTNDNTPVFEFSASEAGSTFQCRIAPAAFASCSNPYTVPAQGEGAHTLEVRAVDAAGNVDASPASRTFTVDTVAPNTTITGGPANGASTGPSVTFSFTSNESATFECSMDAGSTFTPCTSPKTYDPLANGAHDFAVRAVDAAHNTDASPATRSFTSNGAPLETQITGGPAAPPAATADSTPIFTFTSTRPGSTFVCAIDGTSLGACSSPKALSPLVDGLHTFSVVATDSVGESDPTPATRQFRVDTIDPDTSITGGPSGPTASSSATFTFSSNEPAVRFECKVDGGAFVSCNGATSHTAGGLSEGPHSFQVRAVDAADNADPVAASRSWTVDVTAPNTTINSKPPELGNDTTPTFTFSASEGGSTFECRIGLATFAPCSSPHTLAALPQGLHTFEVRAVDAAGNPDLSADNWSFTVEVGPPDSTITLGPGGLTADSTPSFAFVANEHATFRCSLDTVSSGSLQPCTSPYNAPPLPDGAHTFTVQATDDFDNVEVAPATYAFTVDATAPSFPGGATASALADGSVTVSWPAAIDATTGVSSYAVRRALGSVAPASPTAGDAICAPAAAGARTCSDPTPLSGKLYSYAVFAIDGAGNARAIATTVTPLDLTAPATPLNFSAVPAANRVDLRWTPVPPTGASADIAGYVVVRAQGPTAPTAPAGNTVVCTINNPAAALCVAQGLAAQVTYSFSLFAIDEAQNLSAPAALSVKPGGTVLDKTAPGRATKFTVMVAAGKSGATRAMRFTWRNPKDADLKAALLVTNAKRAPRNARDGKVVYTGKGQSKTLQVKAGAKGYFRVFTRDRSNNTRGGRTLTVIAVIPKLTPMAGSELTGTPHLAWRRVRGAEYYQVQVFAGGKRVAIAWVKATTYNVPRAKVKKDVLYTWYVWPGDGAIKAGKFGKLIGKSSFFYGGR